MKPDFSRMLRALSLMILPGLAACGGGGGDNDNGGGPGSGCFYRYGNTPAPILTGADPLLPQQWHLANTGQTGGTAGMDVRAPAAWATGARGDGIRVAVVDDAVETVHEDLAPNAASGAFFDYRSGTATAPLPCAADEDHGTSVAGLILARDGNAVGGAGVAPRASLAAYNALATNRDADIADALRREPSANAIFNNSWGSPDNGALHRAESSFTAAIEAGIDTGRDGKGSIYVFPAGNGGCFIVDGQRCAYDENSNFDGYVNQRGIITVCALDDQGKAPSYAEPGANILVCGMGGGGRTGITTTAPLSKYRSDFAGTSASAPMVSGVAALMLQANPALTWRDVRLILARTARKNDAADAGWVNGFGLNFNHKYGFGLVDAEAAVAAARTWNSVGGSAQMRRCEFSRGPTGNGFPINIPDRVTGQAPSVASDTIAVSSAACAITQVEFVQVQFSAVHSYSGDLRVELVSPGNQTSVLATDRLCNLDGDEFADDCGSYDGWTFGSARHLDEPAVGNWQLRVSDMMALDSGRWTSWRLTLWGR